MKRKHDSALEYIINHPDIICKNKIKVIAKEVKIYRPDTSLLSEIDILAYDGEMYHCEYKSSDKHSTRALQQLQKQRDFIREIYSGKLHSVFMYLKNKKMIKKEIKLK